MGKEVHSYRRVMAVTITPSVATRVEPSGSEDLEFNKCGSDVLAHKQKSKCRGYPRVCLVALSVLFILSQGCLCEVYKRCLEARKSRCVSSFPEALAGWVQYCGNLALTKVQ